MSILKLENIGKIYVSDSNVTVGIREVNLSFELGEFVAVTGKSGSGKSTLLNVISGMDSYEEGEMLIEGNPTSHYMQPDWEEYRQKYISFIFQDYNIIESFTVLENVELALMHIEDKKQRRARALELIERVGLTSHIKHKGSKLSGGQKQRTVIARALAKDSPIILADEPTGNLDSETSKEIIALLRRVSEGKLVIVVTHNYDDFADCATRHVRIHDGFVELDHTVSDRPTAEKNVEQEPIESKPTLAKTLHDGITLGVSIFKSKPRLTIFLCLLMIIGTLGIFGVTALSGDAADIFNKPTMFTHIDGRLVLTTRDGSHISDEELAKLAEKYGAESYLHYDILLDVSRYNNVLLPSYDEAGGYRMISFDCRYGIDYGDDIVGRYPEAKDEAFLYLPIYFKDYFGAKEILVDSITMNNMLIKVVGFKYYHDNNIPPVCLFTDEGFAVATAASYLASSTASLSVNVSGHLGDRLSEQIVVSQLMPSFDIDPGKIYIDSERYVTLAATNEGLKANIDVTAAYFRYSYGYETDTNLTFEKSFTEQDVTNIRPTVAESTYSSGDMLVISDEILVDMVMTALSKSYSQASLFFKNDAEAEAAAELIRDEGYIAVPSYTTYLQSADEAIGGISLAFATAVIWLLAVSFLAFFINLCSLRSIESFKSDMAIMRSMGIPALVIKIGVYVRMALCLIPAFVLLVALAILIYSTKLNAYFTYLYLWQYAVIVLGMIILTLRTTAKQIERLFGESVKKSLKGGNSQ